MRDREFQIIADRGQVDLRELARAAESAAAAGRVLPGPGLGSFQCAEGEAWWDPESPPESTAPVQTLTSTLVPTLAYPGFGTLVPVISTAPGGTTIQTFTIITTQLTSVLSRITLVNVGTQPVVINQFQLVDPTGNVVQAVNANILLAPGNTTYSSFTLFSIGGVLTIRTSSNYIVPPTYTLTTSTLTTLDLTGPTIATSSTIILSTTLTGGTTISVLRLPSWWTFSLTIIVTGAGPVAISSVLTVDQQGNPVVSTSVNLYVPPGQTTFSTFTLFILPTGAVYLSPTPLLGLLWTAIQTLTSTVNAFTAPPGGIVQVQTPGGGSTINGILAPPGNTSTFTAFNTGPGNLTLANNSVLAPTGGAILTSTGSNLTVPPGGSVALTYDPTQSAWVDTNAALGTVAANVSGAVQSIKCTIPFALFTGASMDDTRVVAGSALPAKAYVVGMVLKHSTAWSGGGIGSATLGIKYTASGATILLAVLNVFAAVSDTAVQAKAGPTVNDVLYSGDTLSAELITTLANVNLATAGSAALWVYYVVLP